MTMWNSFSRIFSAKAGQLNRHRQRGGGGGFRYASSTAFTSGSNTTNTARAALFGGLAATAGGLGFFVTSPENEKENENPGELFSVSRAITAAAPAPPPVFPTPLAPILSLFSPMASFGAPSKTLCEGDGGFSFLGRFTNIRKHRSKARTKKDKAAVPGTLEAAYDVDWRNPIGEGSFGAVYTATDRRTGERIAVKKISKTVGADDDEAIRREMEALTHLRDHGGHPNICGLRSHYSQGGYHYLVLEMVGGGEMFDYLCEHGAYSEADAARLISEVASALAFLHGLKVPIVHGDLKPENILLSSKSAAAVVKIVDFGSASFKDAAAAATTTDGGATDGVGPARRRCSKSVQATPAYSPPEFLEHRAEGYVDTEFDLWAVGVILYIMLTGVHPFDLRGDASDEEIEYAIRNGHRPPTRSSPVTAHLSGHAIKLLERLLEWDPEKRLTAAQLLEEPWVRGETARRKKMTNSDKRLAAYRTFKTKLEAKVFADMVSWSDNGPDNGNVAKRTSLIERAFRELDPDDRGYVTAKELRKLAGDGNDDDHHDHHQLSLSGFSDLLSENMKNRYFSTGHLVFKDGEIGNAMYFINSGSVEVLHHDGHELTLHAGDCFGEAALLHPKKIRSDTVRCVTPVHAIEVSREYFEKYLASDDNIQVNLREKDKGRKRHRAKTILQLQKNMKEKSISKGQHVFRKGEEGKELYVVEEGKVGLSVDGHKVASVHPGEMTGEHSLIFGKPRNVDAVCVSDECRLHSLPARDFDLLLDSHPALKEGIRDIAFKREFQKALCYKLGRSFPRTEKELREAFQAIDTGNAGIVTIDDVRIMVKRFDPTYTEDDVRDIMASLSLKESGKVTWAEFSRVFSKGKK